MPTIGLLPDLYAIHAALSPSLKLDINLFVSRRAQDIYPRVDARIIGRCVERISWADKVTLAYQWKEPEHAEEIRNLAQAFGDVLAKEFRHAGRPARDDKRAVGGLRHVERVLYERALGRIEWWLQGWQDGAGIHFG